MKELLLPLGLLAVVAGAVYFFMGGSGTTIGFPKLGTDGAVLAEAKADPVEPAKEPEKQPRRRVAPVPSLAEVTATAPQPDALDAPASVSIPVPAAPKPPRPRVDPAAITVGMPSNRLVEMFGPPTLTATTVSGDGLVETYVYMGNRSGEITRIQLENGRVVNRRQQ